MKTITKNSCVTVRAALNGLKESIEKETGLSLKVGNMTYGMSNITVKLELSLINEDGTAETKERQDFRELAGCYGLDPADLGRKVILNRERFEIVGCKPRSSKYPILCKKLTGGGVYKFPAEAIEKAIKNTATL